MVLVPILKPTDTDSWFFICTGQIAFDHFVTLSNFNGRGSTAGILNRLPLPRSFMAYSTLFCVLTSSSVNQLTTTLYGAI